MQRTREWPGNGASANFRDRYRTAYRHPPDKGHMATPRCRCIPRSRRRCRCNGAPPAPRHPSSSTHSSLDSPAWRLSRYSIETRTLWLLVHSISRWRINNTSKFNVKMYFRIQWKPSRLFYVFLIISIFFCL